DDAKNLRGHLLHRQVSVNAFQPPFRLVIVGHRSRLAIKLVQTLANDFLAVIVANDELGAIVIAKLIDLGRLKVDVVDPSTGGTRTTSGKPAQQLIIVYVQADHIRQPSPAVGVVKELVFQEGIQPACLGRSSRKTVEDETSLAVDLA